MLTARHIKNVSMLVILVFLYIYGVQNLPLTLTQSCNLVKVAAELTTERRLCWLLRLKSRHFLNCEIRALHNIQQRIVLKCEMYADFVTQHAPCTCILHIRVMQYILQLSRRLLKALKYMPCKLFDI